MKKQELVESLLILAFILSITFNSNYSDSLSRSFS